MEKGELQILTVPDWLDRVRKRPSAKAEGKPREDFIVTIDRSDDSTAFIKVRCQLPPRYFTDYLVAMKLADGWQIVSKSYRYDLRGIAITPSAALTAPPVPGKLTRHRNWTRGSQIPDLSDSAGGAGGHRALARRINVAPAILLLLAGIALAFVPGMPSLELPPELVLLLVLPPLIYSASVAMSWREFKFNLRPIILLAVGCVIFTAFAVAAATHYLIGLPWGVGFLLGAIVAPPDVVAPLAIARKLGLPRRILVVLEGEGLANDATALILYRFAVAAISTGCSRCRRRPARSLLIVVGEICCSARRRLAQPADAPPCARSAGRDHAVADHALYRLLDPRAFRRLRRDRDRRLRALYELERAAADLVGDAPAGHLLLGPRDLSDRGLAVPADRLPDAVAVREVEGVSARRHPVRDRAGRGHHHHRAFRLGLSRDLSAAAIEQARCASAIRRRRGSRRS